MKHLLLAIGLLTALLPAQERQRAQRREGPPQELQQRLEQMQHRLDALRARLQDQRGEPGERAPQRNSAPQRRDEPRQPERAGRGMDRQAPMQRPGRPDQLRLRLLQLHQRHRGPMPMLRQQGAERHPMLHRLQQWRQGGPRAGQHPMPERHEPRHGRRHEQPEPRQQKRAPKGKQKRGRDEATAA